MDNEAVKQDLYRAIDEFVALNSTADNETISTLFTTIKVFTDELPVYPNPQTQAQTDAYNLAHAGSEADLIYFSPTEDDQPSSDESIRANTLARLQNTAQQIERLLRTDVEDSAVGGSAIA